MKKYISVYILLLVSVSYIVQAQVLKNNEFDAWSGSVKFDLFYDQPTQQSNTMTRFDHWSSSKKFFHFSDEEIILVPAEENNDETNDRPDTSSFLLPQEENAAEDASIINNTSKINVYPNPAVDRLIVSLSYANFTDVEIILFNSIGNPVFSTNILDKKQVNKIIEVSAFTRGMYFLEIKAEGKKTIKKVIIK